MYIISKIKTTLCAFLINNKLKRPSSHSFFKIKNSLLPRLLINTKTSYGISSFGFFHLTPKYIKLFKTCSEITKKASIEVNVSTASYHSFTDQAWGRRNNNYPQDESFLYTMCVYAQKTR